MNVLIILNKSGSPLRGNRDCRQLVEELGYDTGVCGVVINGEKLTEVIISPQVKNDKIEVHYRTDETKIICTYKAVVDFLKLKSVGVSF